jgi:hypothetical protein
MRSDLAASYAARGRVSKPRGGTMMVRRTYFEQAPKDRTLDVCYHLFAYVTLQDAA